MPVYKYNGVNKKGENVKGIIDADNEKDAQNSLLSQGVKLQSIKRDWTQIEIGGGSVPAKEVMVFTRMFSTMIDAGLSIIQALDILSQQGTCKPFQRILRKVKNSVQEGKSLSESLKGYSHVFDDLYINLVAAGEVGGILDTILEKLAVAKEKSMALEKKVKSAMTYPITILVITIVVVIILMVKVVPAFSGMFMQSGKALPGLTQLVVDISDFFQDHIIIIVIAIIGFVIGLKMLLKLPKVRYAMDKMALQLPIIGETVRKIAVARFTSTMATLIASGVPLVEALEVVSKTAGNKIIENGIVYVRERVMEGQDMTTPLTETGIFPGLVVQMVGVGEATGAMDIMLSKIADFYDEEVNAAVSALTSMLEPLMMVVIGGIVGTILIAMYMPIFSMGKALE